MKKALFLLAMLSMQLSVMAAAGDATEWSLYFYKDDPAIDADQGTFVETGTASVYVIKGLTTTATDISFGVHNSGWATTYAGATVSATGSAVTLSTQTSANGTLSLPAGTYNVTLDMSGSSPTIRFDEVTWSLYLWSDNTSSGADAGTFTATSTADIYKLANVNVSETGLKYSVYDGPQWYSIFSTVEVASLGTAYTMSASSGSDGTLSIPAGTYNVTLDMTDASNPTIKFDEITWSIYLYKDGVYNADAATLTATSETGVYKLAGLTTTDTEIGFNIHDAQWYNAYGGSTVNNAGQAYSMSSSQTASATLNLAAGKYNVTFDISNASVPTVRFDNADEFSLYLYKSGVCDGDAGKFVESTTSGVYILNAVNIADSEISFGVHNGGWSENYAVSTISSVGTDESITASETADGTINIPTGTYNVTFDYNNKTLRFDAVDWYLTGAFNSWALADGMKFTKSATDANLYVLDNVTFDGTGFDDYSGLNMNIVTTAWGERYAYSANLKADGSPYPLSLTTDESTYAYWAAVTKNKTYKLTWNVGTKELTIEAIDDAEDWYIRGDFNSWGTDQKFVQSTSDANVYILHDFTVSSTDVDSYNGFKFQMTKGDYEEKYVCNSTISAVDTEYTFVAKTDGDENWGTASATALTAGHYYKVTWNKSTKTLKFEESNLSSTVYVDNGTIRWKKDNSEVKLFGASYTIMSAGEYRAANNLGHTTLEQKYAMINEDLDHFKRMGFDALRLTFYGDYENSDASGNLEENEHLTLLSYVIKAATDRGIYMLLSPIVDYNSQWPENTYSDYVDDGGTGMARTYGDDGRWKLLFTEQSAHSVACTYLSQLMNYENPFTGHQIKNEPNILFIELMNEPAYASDMLDYYDSYETSYKAAINSFAATVKNTGCQKPLFFNVSQNMNVWSIVQQSDADGGTFAWYPQSISNNHRVEGNGLLWVDRYEPTLNITSNFNFTKPRIVYEFDTADNSDGYMMPAMAREFSRQGMQFASIYSYDMLRTAPYNVANRTHYFNMVYTPQKAVSAMIAAQVMKQGVSGTNSYYPSNSTFGNFSVDYEQRLSMLDDGTHYYYSNNTLTSPADASTIEHIAGCGSSPVVGYDGTGIYFLDKVDDDTWTLEVYPDITEVSDPFANFASLSAITNPSVVRKSTCNTRNFNINLPSLQGYYSVAPGKYTIQTDGVIVSSENLPANDFYAGFASTPDPASESNSDGSSTPDKTITLTTGADGWTHCYYSREYHSPSASLEFVDQTVNSETKPCYHFSVTNLTPSDDYTQYGHSADATLSVYVGDRITSELDDVFVELWIKGGRNGEKAYIVFVDTDGRAWGANIENINAEETLTNEFVKYTIKEESLAPIPAAMLPQDWPGVNSYWYPNSKTNTLTYDQIDWSKIEFVQLTMRDSWYSSEGDNSYNNSHEFWLESIKITGSASLSLSQDDVVASSHKAGYYNVVVDRTFKANQWNTICLPFPLGDYSEEGTHGGDQLSWYFGEGTRVLEFTGVDGEYLDFTSVTKMEANKPYLIKPTQTYFGNYGNVGVDWNVAQNAEVSAWDPIKVTKEDPNGSGRYSFVGADHRQMVRSGDYFISNEKFYISKGASYVGATKAYFIKEDKVNNDSRLVKMFDINPLDYATRIDGVADGNICRKNTDNRIFNLQGQVVGTSLDNLPAGIYINNGKKIMKK